MEVIRASMSKRKTKRREREKAQMGSKVTCSTCGKVWPTRVDYMVDKKKCGKKTCPLTAAAPLKKEIPKKMLEKAENVGHTVTVTSASIPDPMTIQQRKDIPHYYLEVPKVITVEIKRT